MPQQRPRRRRQLEQVPPDQVSRSHLAQLGTARGIMVRSHPKLQHIGWQGVCASLTAHGRIPRGATSSERGFSGNTFVEVGSEKVSVS